MKNLSIWIVTSEFPPMYGGGISTYCREAGVSWVRCGHEVKVFTRGKSDQTESVSKELQERFSVVRVPIVAQKGIQQAIGFWHLMSYCLAEEIIRTVSNTGNAPDMIEVQDYGAVGYFLLKRKLAGAPELSNTKIFIYTHTPVFELVKINQESSYLFPNYWLGQCEKFCLRAADAVISPSEFLKGHLKEYTKSDISVIPYPFLDNQKNSPPFPGDEKSKHDCVYAGRLEYRKGVLQLLAAFKEIWDSGKQVTLRMVGGDTQWVPRQVSMKSHIEKKYAQYINAGLVTFTDTVPPDQLPSVFASGKIVIIPSIYENFPYVCMQAMGLGNPVLVSASGGQAEMVGNDKSCGLVFDWNVSGSFASQLTKLLGKSPEDLAVLGRNGRKRIEELCSFELFVTDRINHFQKISDRPNPKSGLYPFENTPVKNVELNVSQRENTGIQGRLSVIIPFYNMGAYLVETLRSVVSCSYHEIEIIVVNDGSDDIKSLDVLKNTKMDYKQVRVIDIDNAGLANARNVGAKSASGEFIAFLDADDCVESEYYAKCIDLLNKYKNASFAYSWVQYFGESDAIWVNFDTEFPYLLAGNMLAAFQVVRKDDFLAYGINDKNMMFGMEDYEAWLRMASNGCHGISIPELLVRYRVRNDSMARQFNRNTVIYMYEQMARKNDAVYRRYGAELFMLINANGPGYLWNNPTMTYPQLAYAGPGEGSSSESVAMQLSIGELLRLKNMSAHPVLSKLIKFALAIKLDKWFKRKQFK